MKQILSVYPTKHDTYQNLRPRDSEIFFLSKEETRSFLMATNAMEREMLKQQFAFKYLFRVIGGSYDQNREWEVGREHYDSDDGQKLKV